MECGELDAEEVGGQIAKIFDGVALGTSTAYPKCSGVGGRTGNGKRGFVMDDVYGAGVVEVDVDRGDVGVVVDGDFFVWAVVDADDLEGVCGDGGLVVRRKRNLGLLRHGGDRGGEEQEQKLIQ